MLFIKTYAVDQLQMRLQIVIKVNCIADAMMVIDKVKEKPSFAELESFVIVQDKLTD